MGFFVCLFVLFVCLSVGFWGVLCFVLFFLVFGPWDVSHHWTGRFS